MPYVRTNGKPGRPKKGQDAHGNPVQAPKPEPPAHALSVAEAKRSAAVRALEMELPRIDREQVVSASGQPMPQHILRQRQEGRDSICAKIQRLRALAGYELVAEFAPSFLPSSGPEPVRLEETLHRGSYLPRGIKGGTVVEADPVYLAQYRARMAVQAAEAAHQARIKAGQEAIALAALDRQEAALAG